MNKNATDFKDTEPESSQKDTSLLASSPLEITLEKEDYEQTQEPSGIQVKELLSSSSLSDEIILSPNLAPGHETDLKEEEEEKRKKNRYIKKFFASYCEVSTVACVLRERWVLLLSVLICSKMALETQNTEKLVSQLFFVSYCCLAYQMIENLLQYCYLKTKINSRNEKIECLFDFAEKALILFFTSVLNLQYHRLISQWFMVLPPLLFLLEILIYRKHCLISQSQDDMKIVLKIFYVFQSFLIALKMTNIIDLQWRLTLFFLWIYLFSNALYALCAGLLLLSVCVTSILNLDRRTLCLLRSRIWGYIWHIGCYMLHVIGLIVLFGLFEKIDSNEADDTFQCGLKIARNLSFFLVAFSAVLFPILKKANFNLFLDLGTTLQNQVVRQKKYVIVKTEEQKREAFFLMVSSTYFSQLRDMSQSKFEEMMQKNDIDESHAQNKEEEGNLCYICEHNRSNAILAGCGHGGVCCECALKLVEQKNECMECRKPAVAIYKIDNKKSTNNQAEGIVKAHELVEIIEIQ